MKAFLVLSLAAAVAGGSMLLPAQARAVSLGANFGVSMFMPRSGGHVIVIAAPGGALLTPTFQPGLRLGSVSETVGVEFFVDAALAHTSYSEGTGLTTFSATANVLKPFAGNETSTPFVTLGGGVLHSNYDGDSDDNLIVGGGVGVRHRVRDGHGALRGEFRADYVPENGRGSQALMVYGIKFGFDLWMP